MGATALVKVSAAVVYASNSGVKADEVTDNTAAVQATLDGFGSAGTPLEYVFDQPGIVLCAGTIKVWGGQTLRALPGTLLKKAGSSTSNGAPLLQNKHPVAYGAGSQVDQNIILQDLFLDGNRRGGGAGAGGAYPFVNALGYVVPSVVFSGVNSFDIRNVHILDSPSYGLQLSNSANGRVDNFSKFLWPTDTETAGAGDAIIQCQGGTSNVHMYHVFGMPGTTRSRSTPTTATTSRTPPSRSPRGPSPRGRSRTARSTTVISSRIPTAHSASRAGCCRRTRLLTSTTLHSIT